MHWSFHRHSIFPFKLLKNFLSVFLLVDVDTFFVLLDLNPYKELKFSYHAYFKLTLHKIREILTKRFISSSKDNIINIYLNYNEVLANFYSKESCIYFVSTKIIF